MKKFLVMSKAIEAINNTRGDYLVSQASFVEELPPAARVLTRKQVEDLFHQALNVEYPDQVIHLYMQLDELFGDRP